jgi:hypothetical protein
MEARSCGAFPIELLAIEKNQKKMHCRRLTPESRLNPAMAIPREGGCCCGTRKKDCLP